MNQIKDLEQRAKVADAVRKYNKNPTPEKFIEILGRIGTT